MSSRLTAILFLILVSPSLALADDNKQRLVATALPRGATTIEERMQLLENRQAEIYHTLSQKKGAGPGEVLSRKLTLSGLLEVEGTAARRRLADDSRTAASDLTLATLQLGLDATLDEATGATLALLYEEEGDVEVDEATIDLQQDVWQGRIGRQYLPFGAFHSHFISDSSPLALGETRQTALLGSYAGETVTLRAFAFNGNAEQRGSEDHLNDWGASVTATPATGIELGASYLSDLAESSTDLLGGDPWTWRVGGWSAFLHVEHGAVTVEGEYLAATRAFAAGDLDVDGNGRGDRPRAWNLELVWNVRPELEVATRLGGSSELTGEARRQYGAGASWNLKENSTLSIEYLHGVHATAFTPTIGGGSVDSDERFTVQLALAF